jgi:flagellar hook assembly protein FlgD
VRLSILDAQGRRVATPFDGAAGAGTFETRWSGRRPDGAQAPAGVYFARLELPGLSQTRRLALVR